MSRASLTRLCHDAVRARASLFAPCRTRSSASSVKTAAVAGDWSNTSDTTAAKHSSACPMSNVVASAGTNKASPVAESRRSAHFVPQDTMSTMGEHVQNASITLPEDKTSFEQQSKQPQTNTTSYFDFDAARPFSEMPSPANLPFIGAMWLHLPMGPLYGLTFDEKISRMYDMYGPIHKERIFNFTIVHVYKPSDMEIVYRADGIRPVRDAFHTLKKYNEEFNIVQGILTSQGDEWHRLRSKAQVRMMKPQSAAAYLDLHTDVSNDFVATIDRLRDQDGVVEDLLPSLYNFGLEAIGCVCFNRRLGALEKDIPADSDAFKFIKAVSDVMESTHSELKLMFKSSSSATFKKLAAAQSFIRQLSIREAKKTLEMIDRGDEEIKGDLLPYLMTSTDLSEAEVMTLISEFFFAGVDTTSHFLGFALYHMSVNPEVQEKLVAEIEEHVGEDDTISSNTLGRMSYFRASVKETFRRHPVAPGNGRTTTKDIVLSGYRVPAGTLLGLHHDWASRSSQYVKDPDRFMPERWLRGHNSPHSDIHPFVSMPFGFGPRSCLGRRFAEQEFSLVLIKILQKYHVEYAYHKKLEHEMCMINKPTTPLRFRFVPRR